MQKQPLVKQTKGFTRGQNRPLEIKLIKERKKTMKKVLCLAIAIIMVVSLGVTALANPTGYRAPADGWVDIGSFNFTQLATGLTGGNVSPDYNVFVPVPALTVTRGTGMPNTIELRAQVDDSATPFTVPGAADTRDIVVTLQMRPVASHGPTLTIPAATAFADVDFTADPATGMPNITQSLAAPATTWPQTNAPVIPRLDQNWRIRGVNPDAQMIFNESYFTVDRGEIVGGVIRGDTQVNVLLRPDMFLWQHRSGGSWTNADLPSWAEGDPHAITAAHLDQVTVRHTVRSGHRDLIDRVALRHITIGGVRYAVVTIYTPEFMTRAGGPFDVSLDIILRASGGSQSVSTWDLRIGNARSEVWSDDSFVTVGHREYIRATENVRNIEIEAGEITFFRDITRERNIYVYASTELSFSGEDLYRRFPEIIDVIEVYHSGMNVAGVRWEIEGRSTNFVYDGRTGAYLGTTNDTFQGFRDRIILTNARIDRELAAALGGEEVEGPAEEPQDPDVPDLGGAPTPPPNVNFNPGTGR